MLFKSSIAIELFVDYISPADCYGTETTSYVTLDFPRCREKYVCTDAAKSVFSCIFVSLIWKGPLF
jgi:hypothetical protein